MDVNKIQEKSVLARELINKGVVADYEAACQMIDEKGLVKNSSVPNYGSAMPQQNMNNERNEHGDNRRLADLEKSLAQIKDFIMRYTKNNDSNLREIDEKMNRILQFQSKTSQNSIIEESEEIIVEENKTPEKINTVAQPIQQQLPTQAKKSNHPQGHLNPNDFAVEKYFNNSHGKLKGK